MEWYKEEMPGEVIRVNQRTGHVSRGSGREGFAAPRRNVVVPVESMDRFNSLKKDIEVVEVVEEVAIVDDQDLNAVDKAVLARHVSGIPTSKRSITSIGAPGDKDSRLLNTFADRRSLTTSSKNSSTCVRGVSSVGFTRIPGPQPLDASLSRTFDSSARSFSDFRHSRSSGKLYPVFQAPVDPASCGYTQFAGAHKLEKATSWTDKWRPSRRRSARKFKNGVLRVNTYTELDHDLVFERAKILDVKSPQEILVEVLPSVIPSFAMDLMKAGLHFSCNGCGEFDRTWQSKVLREKGFRLRTDGSLVYSFKARLHGVKSLPKKDELESVAMSALRDMLFGKIVKLIVLGIDDNKYAVVDVTTPGAKLSVAEMLLSRGFAARDGSYDTRESSMVLHASMTRMSSGKMSRTSTAAC